MITLGWSSDGYCSVIEFGRSRGTWHQVENVRRLKGPGTTVSHHDLIESVKVIAKNISSTNIDVASIA